MDSIADAALESFDLFNRLKIFIFNLRGLLSLNPLVGKGNTRCQLSWCVGKPPAWESWSLIS